MATIDLNSDLGEAFGPWRMGDDEALMEVVTSVNVACGGHAGDHATMTTTVARAAASGLGVGAHPSFPDKQGFGRRVIPMSTDEIEQVVATQVGALCGAAALNGVRVTHVKAHGALANLASAEAEVADAVARATRAVDPDLVLLAIAGTQLEHAAGRASLAVAREGFADRAYLPDGRLAPRDLPGAVVHDVEEATARTLAMAGGRGLPLLDGGWLEQEVDSICVHGDTQGAVVMARRIRGALEEEGYAVEPFHRTLR